MQTLQVDGSANELQVDAVPNLLQVDGGSDIAILDSLGVTMVLVLSHVGKRQPQIVITT